VILDLQNSETVVPRHTSVCIAGAGAAGICLAVELARAGVSVTLLESGGTGDEAATQALYSSANTGLRHRGIHEGRFRVLGGSTTRWAGQILELDPHIFDDRPWVPNGGWPIDKGALSAYYRRALELEGLASSHPDDESVWRDIRCAAPQFGEELVPYFSKWCPEPNFARLHGEKLRESKKINVYLHANVCEILLTEGHQAIHGLVCRTLDGRSIRFTADRYVLCLGGIESARLLLQPLKGTWVAPWNERGLLGRYFQDHIDVTALEVKPRSVRQFCRWFDNVYSSSIKYQPFLKLSAAEQQRRECLSISGQFEFKNAKMEVYEEFLEFAARMRRGQVEAKDALEAVRYVPLAGFLAHKTLRYKFQRRGHNASGSGIFLRFHTEQSPNRDSRIELSSERDATGMLRCSLHWAVTEQETHTMQHFARVVGEAFRRNDFAEVVTDPALEAGGAELTSLFVDTFHHMGATRMADSPQRGVVDKNLRLFGIENGYVCSSSVFPTSGFSNPTHTLIALASRLAEHLGTVVQRTNAVAMETAEVAVNFDGALIGNPGGLTNGQSPA
jgi:choline dehydrogenase-like flavoprotein